MNPAHAPLAITHRQPAAPDDVRRPAPLPPWRRNLLRVGYLVIAAGLAVTRWPLLVDHGAWGLKAGTIECMLVALSVLALLGLRHPVRMLPLLLFEVTWKLTWLAVVALPRWRHGTLVGAAREQTNAVLWVVIIVAVVPWRHLLTQYLTVPGEPWRRR
jgi:hypothetical protein